MYIPNRKILAVISITAILASLTGSTNLVPARAVAPSFFDIFTEHVTGSGTAGTGSIAAAALFSRASSNGAGGFAGRFVPLVLGQTLSIKGVFSLTTASSDLIPVIPCASGEVGAQGTVVFGNFTGQTVVVFGCVGTGTVGGLRIIDMRSSPIIITFDGVGHGDRVSNPFPSVVMLSVAANTDGSGSAGTGSVDFAEVSEITSETEALLSGGGAFVGTLSGGGAVTPVSGTFGIDNVSLSASLCNANLSGAIANGSFLGQRVTTSVSLVNCPPPIFGPGPHDATLVLTIGTGSNIIYRGKGMGTIKNDDPVPVLA